MCWGLHIMEGNAVVREINTTGAAVAFFGSGSVRYDLRYTDPSAVDRRLETTPEQDVANGDFCLCPIDIDYLLERTGYRRIDYDDLRWDSMDTRIELTQEEAKHTEKAG